MYGYLISMWPTSGLCFRKESSTVKTYRFLLFDADGTLLDFDQDMDKAFRATYRACFGDQRPFSQELLDCYEQCNTRWWAKLERGECTKPELVVARFRDFLAETGLTGEPEKINQEYFKNLGQGGAVYPGALELIRDLSKSYELYIVTNGNAVTQRTRLEHSGLMNYVKTYFVSEDAGAAKPDPRYFDYVFSRIPSFEKDRALLLGDSLTSDMLGAQNAGLDSLWYAPHGGELPEGLSVTYQARTYKEIANLLL